MFALHAKFISLPFLPRRAVSVGGQTFHRWNHEIPINVPSEHRSRLVVGFLLGATAGAAIVACSVLTASAAVVCNGNVCWHTHERYTYPPSAGVVIHEDDWRAGPGITFREHEGRGYWRGESWTDF
ncbi:MAG: hypothetical protein WBG18_18360 [Xanthobacteraceae bacterium]